MRPLLFCLPILIFTSPSLADPPSLTLPAKITGKPGAFLTVAATTSGKNVAWLSLDPGLNLFPTQLLKDSRTAVVTSGTPGTYRLMAVTAANDEISTPAVCQIVIEADTPPSPPAPKPNPPAPQPAARVSWAIVVIDNSRRTGAQGQLLGSPTLFASVQQKGVSFRVFDVTDPLVTSNNYAAGVTAAGGVPALLLLTSDGKCVKAIPLPADEASFLAAIPVSMMSVEPTSSCIV